ncbi:MAG: NAD(P)/FAD-dependent oxidoreductase, partial [Nitrospira sp. SB0666_bin_27]|nr:NAD(P)/FAD-dependent oxidoreductase [Nitrospira sp. SB0666_bin_27]
MKKNWDVVILGGGFAGLTCAKRLERLWREKSAQRILLVSAENYFVFQPYLPEVIGASIETRHVTNTNR